MPHVLCNSLQDFEATATQKHFGIERIVKRILKKKHESLGCVASFEKRVVYKMRTFLFSPFWGYVSNLKIPRFPFDVLVTGTPGGLCHLSKSGHRWRIPTFFGSFLILFGCYFGMPFSPGDVIFVGDGFEGSANTFSAESQLLKARLRH